MHLLFSVYLKMLVLYSPFFVLSCFISSAAASARATASAWPGGWPWRR